MAIITSSPTETMSTSTRAAALEAEQYLHSRLTSPQTSTTIHSLPIIDLQPSFSGSLPARQEVAKQINEACTSIGFFYITGHGLESTCEAILKLAPRFFSELSQESKDAIHLQKSKYHRGYEPPSYTSVNGLYGRSKETKEAFNWGYEEGLDPTGGDGKYVELDGSKPDKNANLWPKEKELPGFYEGVADYYGKMLQLCRHLFKLFALSLALPEDYFDSMTTHPGGIARLIKYRPSDKATSRPLSDQPETDEDQDSEEIGLGAHSDYECFTLLIQDSNPGLEVLSPDGGARWISVAPLKGGIVVNVADFLMRWTNGIYRSTIHRVVNRSGKERYSVPLFFSINYDEMVETLPSCVSEERPSRYPPINAGRYVLDRLALTVEGKY